MAHFAKIVDGIVTEVVVVDNEHEVYGEQYLNDLGLAGRWIQTSYNGNFRGAFAGIGFTYDEELDEFIAPVSDEIPVTEPPVVVENPDPTV